VSENPYGGTVGKRNRTHVLEFLALWLGTKVDFAKMGLSFSRIFERMFGKKEMRILMVGLDAAGKVSFDTINTRLEAV
jgi:hypothetical protein